MGQALSKHPGGRPTKYNRAILDTMQDYISNYKALGHKIPSIAGLAQVLDCDRETLTVWSEHEDKPEFSSMYRKLQRAQEFALTENGLDGTYNSNITKLILSKHGYSDNQDKVGTQVNVTIKRGETEVEVGGQTMTIDNKTPA